MEAFATPRSSSKVSLSKADHSESQVVAGGSGAERLETLFDFRKVVKTLLQVTETHLEGLPSKNRSSSKQSLKSQPEAGPSNAKAASKPKGCLPRVSKPSAENYERKDKFMELHDLQGFYVLKKLPPKKATVFVALSYLLNGYYDRQCCTVMRNTVADWITSDPKSYDKTRLGCSNVDYAKWLLNEEIPGGVVELQILATLYCLEIDLVCRDDMAIRRFGVNKYRSLRVFIYVEGAHFEPIYIQGSCKDIAMTIFPIELDSVYDDMKKLLRVLKYNQPAMDKRLPWLPWRCLECKDDLAGEYQAQHHSFATGHKFLANL